MFDNLSPLDHRYYRANRELFDRLRSSLSETAAVQYCLRVELALLESHVHHQFDGETSLIEAIHNASEEITAFEVYEEEEQTQHNIRALVHVLQRHLPERLRPFVHLGATSVDILDTAQALRFRDAVRGVILPLLIDLESALITHAETEAETPEVGRTHGQYAVPITFGFALGEYVARLGKAIAEIEKRSSDLRGKLSGAVGAYNATSMIVADPIALEADFLGRLGLEASDVATQMVEPEYLVRLIAEIQIAFGVVANLADDLRHLQRSEIDEVREFFSDTQVGSSTMPQKRNPWNCEHVKSLWKAFTPRVLTTFLDQISEHQRDLTNSASMRFLTEYLAGFTAAVERMRKIVVRMSVNRDRMREHLDSSGGRVLAEPVYILLALSGTADAHEVVRKLTLEAEERGISFAETLTQHAEVWHTVKEELARRTGLDAEVLLSSPHMYRGLAADRARALTARYREAMQAIKERLF